MNLKGRSFSYIKGLYTRGNSLSSGFGGRVKEKEKRRNSGGSLQREKCGSDF